MNCHSCPPPQNQSTFYSPFLCPQTHPFHYQDFHVFLMVCPSFGCSALHPTPTSHPTFKFSVTHIIYYNIFSQPLSINFSPSQFNLYTYAILLLIHRILAYNFSKKKNQGHLILLQRPRPTSEILLPANHFVESSNPSR